MAALFAGLAGLAKAATARVSGEPVTLLPMARPAGINGVAVADETRTPVEGLVAIFAEMPSEVFEDARVASFSRTPSAGSALTATFDLADLVIVADLDRLRREDTGEVYVLKVKKPDGFGGATWRLAAVAA